MPKRPPTNDEALDIFQGDRLEKAMAGAVGDVAEEVNSKALEAREEDREVEPEEKVAALKVLDVEASRGAKSGSDDARRAAVVAPTPERKPVARQEVVEEVAPASATIEANVPLKLRVPQSMRTDFQTFKAELSAVLGGVALDDSNLGRPLLEWFLMEYRDRILEAAASRRGEMKRPANGDGVGMAEFDHAIGEVFREAMKRRRRQKEDQPRA